MSSLDPNFSKTKCVFDAFRKKKCKISLCATVTWDKSRPNHHSFNQSPPGRIGRLKKTDLNPRKKKRCLTVASLKFPAFFTSVCWKPSNVAGEDFFSAQKTCNRSTKRLPELLDSSTASKEELVCKVVFAFQNKRIYAESVYRRF